MKRSLAHLTLGMLLLGGPIVAQETTTPVKPQVRRPEALEQAAQKLESLAPTQAQASALMELFLRELPHIMDENADPLSLARRIEPEAERLLDRNQLNMLRAMSSETSGLMQIGTMNSKERHNLVRGGLERLSHPDTAEWLKRIDSFDI